MSARITFLDEVPTASAGRRAILVPRTAVDRRDGTAVWVLEGDRVRRRPVELGAAFGEQVQVTSGLTGDERFVVGDTGALRDGQLVRAPQP